LYSYSHSSSKNFVHPSHLHHHLFASNNKHHLFHNLPHLFFVNDHHNHQLQLLLKQLFETLLLYRYHHDQSSLNVSQLLQLNHVSIFFSFYKTSLVFIIR
jgi:hypothetical protein